MSSSNKQYNKNFTKLEYLIISDETEKQRTNIFEIKKIKQQNNK